MNPTSFPEVNTTFRTPAELSEQQVVPVRGYVHQVAGGSMDGACLCVTCWQPTQAEIESIMEGKPIFLSFLGGVPPHYPSMSFEEATHPA